MVNWCTHCFFLHWCIQNVATNFAILRKFLQIHRKLVQWFVCVYYREIAPMLNMFSVNIGWVGHNFWMYRGFLLHSATWFLHFFLLQTYGDLLNKFFFCYMGTLEMLQILLQVYKKKVAKMLHSGKMLHKLLHMMDTLLFFATNVECFFFIFRIICRFGHRLMGWIYLSGANTARSGVPWWA